MMTKNMGMTRPETKNLGDDLVVLQWGQCKRPRLSKASAAPLAQRLEVPSLPDARSTHCINMQQRAVAAAEFLSKGETENSCIDHLSLSSEKPGKDCTLTEKFINKNVVSPCRNGQTRRRTELESLHDKHLEMKDLNLKLLTSLSHKEKEDDFLVMKGSRLPQRPRKRAKHVEKFVTYVSPGSWLCEVSLERYEVREKKCMKRKPTGLKAMESLDSDSG